MLKTLLKSLKNDFIRERENFQEGVVGGKMNSDNFCHKIKVASLGLLNNIVGFTHTDICPIIVPPTIVLLTGQITIYILGYYVVPEIGAETINHN